MARGQNTDKICLIIIVEEMYVQIWSKLKFFNNNVSLGGEYAENPFPHPDLSKNVDLNALATYFANTLLF